MYHVIVNDVIGPDFFEFIDNEVSNSEPLKEALVWGKKDEGNVPNDMRRSKITWLTNEGLRNDLFSIVQRVNAKHFGFNIWNMADMQYTIYDAEEEGHYDWHQDDSVSTGPNRASARKLSLTIQLSDPDEYEGGNFEFFRLGSVNEEARNKGTILVFPSSHLHRVTPVTKGVRKSLVAWFEGPSWR